MGFRHDINGLRAWAVIAVIFFHFEIVGFVGGFVGVDVFFVISGFLMTKIIHEGHTNPNLGRTRFRITEFYAGRARRIIPALAAYSMAMLIFGWVMLTDSEYMDLGNEALFAITFASNYRYWLLPEGFGGYFADGETVRWFLHTWSLSVEWQFYVLYPILIVALRKLNLSTWKLMGALFSVGSASFVASITGSNSDSELAFYSIHTRAWEMIAGGLVFIVQTRKSIKARYAIILEYAGYSILLISIFADHPTDQWPGYRAVFPVFGTAFILLANRQNSVLSNTGIAQFVGKISYSAYLWHWPVVVWLKYVGLLSDPKFVVLGFLLTVFLSIISFYAIESSATKWFRRERVWKTTTISVGMVLAPAVLGFSPRLMPQLSTLPSLTQHASVPLPYEDKNPRRDECHKRGQVPGPMCRFGGAHLAAIALGDSHSISVVSAIEASLPHDELHVMSLSSSSCRTLLEAKSIVSAFRCRDYNQWAIDLISAQPNWVPVIITNRTSSALFGRNEDPASLRRPTIFYGETPGERNTRSLLENYRRDQISVLCKLAAQRPTFVVHPIPEMEVNVGKLTARRARFGMTSNFSIDREAYDLRHEFVRDTYEQAATECGVKLLDPTDFLCDQDKCWGTKDGIVLYYDSNHMSETGNRSLVPMFNYIWKSVEIGTTR